MKQVRNQRGQGLVEYLIIVALIAVGSIALIRAVGNNMSARYAEVVIALGGSVQGADRRVEAEQVTQEMYKKRDLKNFMNGSISVE